MKLLTRPWFLALVFVTAFVLWPGCATSSPYRGAVGDRPILTVSYLRHVVPSVDPRFPEHVETLATAHLVNPSMHPMRLRLECSRSLTTVDVPARTSTDVLLDAHDRSCALTEVRS